MDVKRTAVKAKMPCPYLIRLANAPVVSNVLPKGIIPI